MPRVKNTIIEYRDYHLPTYFPIVLLTGEIWRISDVRSNRLHFHNCLEIGLCEEFGGVMEFGDEARRFKFGDVTLVGSDVVHWNSSDGQANHPVNVKTTGTLTGKVYASALDNVRKINTACSAFGGRNIYAYSLGGDYLGKSGLVQTGVLTDKEAIKRAFEGAFAAFENCIPPKETQKCR